MYFRFIEHESFTELKFLAPESANALSLGAARELALLGPRVAEAGKPVVVRSGHARMFCSGGNLSDYAKIKGKTPGLKVNREITRLLDAFGKWPVPKLAVVEGDVLGGGMEWLVRFDFRWSTPGPVFAFWQRRIGLSSGWGGGRAWAAKLGGEAKVRQLLLEGRILSAAECARLGLIDRVVSPWSTERAIADWGRVAGGRTGCKLSGWTAAGEVKMFTDLWMGPEHSATLKKWK